jgi:hypothetical protein
MYYPLWGRNIHPLIHNQSYHNKILGILIPVYLFVYQQEQLCRNPYGIYRNALQMGQQVRGIE